MLQCFTEAVVTVTGEGWKSYHIALEFIREKGLWDEYKEYVRREGLK
jgi:hypothetical protein